MFQNIKRTVGFFLIKKTINKFNRFITRGPISKAVPVWICPVPLEWIARHLFLSLSNSGRRIVGPCFTQNVGVIFDALLLFKHLSINSDINGFLRK